MENKKIDYSEYIGNMTYYLLKRASGLTHIELINGLDNIENYQVYNKKKKSGGVREICAPHEDLCKLQRGLLDNFFYRILKRSNYYKYPWNKGKVELIMYKKSLAHTISNELHGSLPDRSIRTASTMHVHKHHLFATHFDLKNAFSSVGIIPLSMVLHRIITDDILSYYYPFKKKKEDKKMIQLINEYIDRNREQYCKTMVGNLQSMQFEDISEHIIKVVYDLTFSKIGLRDMYPPTERPKNNIDRMSKKWDGDKRKTSLINRYPKHPLFSSNDFSEFRKLIRETIEKDVEYAMSIIPDLILAFVKKLLQICTYNNVLPQGAPTSGFLLALILSEFKVIEKIKSTLDPDEIATISFYVDDIVIMSNKRPTDEWKARIVKAIEDTKIFKINTKKTYTVDLRSMAMPFLGGKIALSPKLEFNEVSSDPETGKREITRDVVKNPITGENIMKLSYTLSKKTQKQYRAFIHHVCVNDCGEDAINKARGYVGRIISVYGIPSLVYPSSLYNTVLAFKEKYPIYYKFYPLEGEGTLGQFMFSKQLEKYMRSRT